MRTVRFSIVFAFLLINFACAQNEESTDGAAQQTQSLAATEKVDTDSCARLSRPEFDLLQQLQDSISYPVLVPNCLPPGYSLTTNSVKRADPAPSDYGRNGNHPEASYRYEISNAAATIEFGANIIGDAGLMKQDLMQVRKHQGLVYHSLSAPLENSSTYYVLWSEERDLDPRDRYGLYLASARNIGWRQLLPIIDGMIPLSDAAEPSAELSGAVDGNGARLSESAENTASGQAEECSSSMLAGAQVQLTTDAAADDNPSWSPDGCRIAFSSRRDGNAEIYIMNADGSGQTRITNSKADDSAPAWSPDGKKIAFSSRSSSGDRAIYVIEVGGGGVERLSDNPADDWNPSWSPDGTKIAYANGDTKSIFVMNADGTNPVDLGSVSGMYPAWSPDGTKIAFYHSQGVGGSGIFVMNADGSNPLQLDSGNSHEGHPSWSPDGSRLVFHGGGAGGNIICVINADGSNFFTIPGVDAYNRDPSWSPDGSRIAFSVGGSGPGSTSDIYVQSM